MKIQAAAYIRVSTEDQTEYSPDAQLRAIKKYAEDNDFLLLSEHIYTDAGISGRTAAKRPAFMRMIAAAKNKEKPFQVILVHKLDRFSRNKEESVAFKAALKKDGIKVISVTEHIDDDKFGIILESMLEAMAEYYSLNLSEEVRKGQTEKARRGEFQSKPCFGYNMVNGQLVPDPDEAQYVEYIYNAFINGTSIKQIAYRLQSRGILTKAKKPFTDDGVRYILRNPTYKGYAHWTSGGRTADTKKLRFGSNTPDTIIAKGNWKPIINDELWEKASELWHRQYAMHRRKARPASEYAGCLSALIKCDTCGSSLVYCNNRRSMQCNNYGHAKCTVSHCISVKKIENAIEQELTDIFNAVNLDNYNITQKTIVPNDNIFTEKQIASLEKKISRLKTAYLNEVISIDEFKSDKKQLEAEIQTLKNDMKTVPEKNEINISEFKKKAAMVKNVFVGDYTFSEKSAALKSIISKIVYVKSEKKLVFYYYI